MISRELREDMQYREAALLGALLAGDIQPSDIWLATDEFSDPHAPIMDAIRRNDQHGLPVDLIPVWETLQSDGVDYGLDYLTNLIGSRCQPASVKHHQEGIRKASRMARIALRASQLVVDASNPKNALDGVLDAFMADIERISDGGTAESETIPISKIMQSALTDMDARAERGGVPDGHQTGLTDFDRAIGGLRGGEMIVIAGRPGMGKTAFAMDIANRVSHGKHVAVFALEMGQLQTGYRVLSSLSGVSMSRLTREDLTDNDYILLTAGVEKVRKLDQRWCFDSAPDMGKIRRIAHNLKRRHGLDMIVIDYLQLMEGEGENRVNEISKISRAIKQLAKQLNVPIIALSQLSRKVEERADKKPMLSDLRESGAIEQDADIVIGMWRPGYYWPDVEQHYAAALILKNRQGESGAVHLFCDMGLQRFGNWGGGEPMVQTGGGKASGGAYGGF